MWQDETYSLKELGEKAVHYDELWVEGGKPYALDFLYWADIIPQSVDWKRGNSIPRKFLDGDAIPAVYLAEVAKSWDDLGWAPATEFIEMLAFEVTGTPQSNTLMETMSDLGRR